MDFNQLDFTSIRVVACDLDGTFLDSSHNPHPANILARQHFLDAGGLFIICTGRNISESQHAFQGIIDLKKVPGVYINGALTIGPNGKMLDQVSLPSSVIQKLIVWQETYKQKCALSYWTDFKYFVINKNLPWSMHGHVHYGLMQPSEATKEELLSQILFKAEIWGESTFLDKVMIEVRALAEEFDIVRATPTVIHINPLGIDKATGLSKLVKKLGYTFDQTVAIGDGGNDIEMLSSAKIGIAMGNASSRVQAEAGNVTLSNADGGVAIVLDKVTKMLKSQNISKKIKCSPLQNTAPPLKKVKKNEKK